MDLKLEVGEIKEPQLYGLSWKTIERNEGIFSALSVLITVGDLFGCEMTFKCRPEVTDDEITKLSELVTFFASPPESVVDTIPLEVKSFVDRRQRLFKAKENKRYKGSITNAKGSS